MEVGPGAGAISEYLLKATERKYTAIEFDQEKVDYLNKKYPNSHFVQQDFLKYPIQEEILLCGNYPYNISGPILFKTLENIDFILLGAPF